MSTTFARGSVLGGFGSPSPLADSHRLDLKVNPACPDLSILYDAGGRTFSMCGAALAQVSSSSVSGSVCCLFGQQISKQPFRAAPMVAPKILEIIQREHKASRMTPSTKNIHDDSLAIRWLSEFSSPPTPAASRPCEARLCNEPPSSSEGKVHSWLNMNIAMKV